MTNRPPTPELPDDWMLTLHEAIASDTQVEPQTAIEEPANQQFAQVRSCLNLLEDLRQANLASGGMIRELLETSENAPEKDEFEPTRILSFE